MTSNNNIENAYLRADVKSPTLPVSLSGKLSANFNIAIERNVVDNERAILTHCVYSERSRGARLLQISVSFSFFESQDDER